MTEVFSLAEQVTRHREQALVESALLTSLMDMLSSGRRGPTMRLFRLTDNGSGKKPVVVLAAWSKGRKIISGEQDLKDAEVPVKVKLALETNAIIVENRDKVKYEPWHYCWIPIVREDVAIACIELALRLPISNFKLRILDSVRGLFANYISLLHYSQIDTLTRLLNRKTFDESMHSLLNSEIAPLNSSKKERRAKDGRGEHWLAVLDLDYFKRVNDQYGHLFGDEVLRGVADVMRVVFRRHDKLFRFGGEEFVVIVRNISEANAIKVFERFRNNVAKHEFPTVGKVTVSIGLTRVRQNDSPTTLLGRADDALYYAKQNGRNQIGYHEKLVAEGLLKPAPS